jgi:Tfp pilus assembly protein PilX
MPTNTYINTRTKKRQEGFALITALGITVILMGIIGIMVVGSVGDLQQSRSSIQLSQARAAAEAGIAVGHDALQSTTFNSNLSTVLNTYSTTFVNNGNDPTTTWVVPQNNWATVASSLQTSLNNTAASNAVPSSALSSMGSATITYQLSNFRGRLLATTAVASNQNYVMDYTITATGTANGGTRTVTEQGTFTVLMGQGSLNRYLFLVNNAGGQGGYFGTNSVFNGPVHANLNWGFRGTPTFNGPVTASNGSNANWSSVGLTNPSTLGIYHWCSGSRTLSLATSNPPCSTPAFNGGFNYVATPIPLPTTALGQARAALGLNPAVTSGGVPVAPTPLETCQQLNLSATCSPVLTPGTGVYLPNDGTNITGGIYIQGNVTSMTLTKPAALQQQYTIVQGTTTTTILINHAAPVSTTITRNPGGTTTYAGAPNGQAPVGTGGANGQIFVNGTLNGLTGPARPNPDTTPLNSPQHPVPNTISPALAKETQLNITATGQVGITGDLTYECDPKPNNAATYLAANPNCNMNGQPLKTVLGVMSTGSDVQVRSTAPNDIYLWGSYYTATANMGLSVQGLTDTNAAGLPTTRGNSGTMHLFGGLIQNTDQLRGEENSAGTLVNGFNESFDYDTRFSNGAVTPPNFPTTRTFAPNVGAPIPLTFSEK